MAGTTAGDGAQSDRVAVSPAQGSLLDAVRGFGMMSGPTFVLEVLVGACVVATVRGALARPRRNRLERLLRPLVALGAAAPAVYLLAVRPWHLRWGATDQEVRKPLPGDELVPEPGIESTRAVTVQAPVEAVWPWLAQLGQDRGGFYSYEWLENLAGCRLRNADRIHPEWQQRAVGDWVLLHPASGMKVARFEPERVFALEGGWYFVLEPGANRTTRLIARSRVPRGLQALSYGLLVEIPHFVMERKMLLGLKERAERAWARRATAERVVHRSDAPRDG